MPPYPVLRTHRPAGGSTAQPEPVTAIGGVDGGGDGGGSVGGGEGGGGDSGSEGEDDAVCMARSTGSHRVGKVTPQTEGSTFELGWYSVSSSCTMMTSAGWPRISEYPLVSQVLEPAELTSRSTSVS